MVLLRQPWLGMLSLLLKSDQATFLLSVYTAQGLHWEILLKSALWVLPSQRMQHQLRIRSHWVTPLLYLHPFVHHVIMSVIIRYLVQHSKVLSEGSMPLQGFKCDAYNVRFQPLESLDLCFSMRIAKQTGRLNLRGAPCSTSASCKYLLSKLGDGQHWDICLKTIWLSYDFLSRNPQTAVTDWVTLSAGSVKACYGHTEGAAGLHGALCVFLSLQQQIAPPIMHLRNMNPYVTAALADWRSASGLQAAVPRVRLHYMRTQVHTWRAVLTSVVYARKATPWHFPLV